MKSLYPLLAFLIFSGFAYPPPSSEQVTAIEQEVHVGINEYRAKKGLSPLKRDSTLDEIAREHSRHMLKKRKISHQGFDSRYKRIIKTLGANGAAENVASNFGYKDPATTAVLGWIKSKGHRQNIKDDFNLTGIGVVWDEKKKGYYLTQLFAKVP